MSDNDFAEKLDQELYKHYASKSEMRRVEYMKANKVDSDTIHVLREFVTDCESVYGVDCFNDDEFEGDWSDLAVTYRKAKEVLLAT